MIGSGNIMHITNDYSVKDNYKYSNKFGDVIKEKRLGFVTNNNSSILKNIDELLSIEIPKIIHLYINDNCDLLVLENEKNSINNSEHLLLENIEIVCQLCGESKTHFAFLGKTQSNYYCFISYTKSKDILHCDYYVLSKDKEKLFNHYCRLYKLNSKEVIYAKLEANIVNEKNAKTKQKI